MLDALGVCGGDCLIDQNNNGICDIDELGVGSCGPESCGPGTVWDPETQACIVAYPADTNFDGCVQLNDLLLPPRMNNRLGPAVTRSSTKATTTRLCR